MQDLLSSWQICAKVGNITTTSKTLSLTRVESPGDGITLIQTSVLT